MITTMKIPSRELWSYFGYGVGQCFSFGLVGSFINYFYTDVLGISALAASTIFLIARAWDAVHDPLFASIMDIINSRFGKFRHFLLIAPLLITGVTLLSFYKIDASMTTKILYAGLTYILWGTLYAISDIPFWSMSSVMTNDSAQRVRVVTAAMLGVNVGIACANIFFPKLAAFFAQYSDDKGYFMAALIMMLVGLPLMLNGFVQIKERVPPSPEKVTIRDTFYIFTFTEEKHAEICRLLVERNMSAKILDTPGLEPESGFRRCAHSDRCTDSKIKCCIRERGPSGCNIRRYSNRYNRKLRWSFKNR